MTDPEKQAQFVLLRAEGRSFNRLAQELGISKPTLIKWSRKFQFEIQNQRVIHLEGLREKWLSDSHLDDLGARLKRVEEELAKRDIAELSTGKLFAMADSLRRQIKLETGETRFTSPIKEIPDDEYIEQVQDWKP